MATETHHSSHHAPPSDKGAAYTGLILGVIALTALVYGVTIWTNSLFEGKAAAHGAAAKQH
jgi:hypothetical protein